MVEVMQKVANVDDELENTFKITANGFLRKTVKYLL